jgi:hypothetical protein
MTTNPFFGNLFPANFFPRGFFFDRYEITPPPTGWGGAGTCTITHKRRKPLTISEPPKAERQAKPPTAEKKAVVQRRTDSTAEREPDEPFTEEADELVIFLTCALHVINQ